MTSDNQRPRDTYSRSELELELARLALTVKRAAPQGQQNPLAIERSLDIAVRGVLDDSIRLLERTRASHRSMVTSRLNHLAASTELGIIGFSSWLSAHEPHWRQTSDRQPAIRQPNRQPLRDDRRGDRHA